MGPQGNVVVADTDNHRLQVIRPSDGACLRTIGSEGSGAGHFDSPHGIAFDSAGHIIVADMKNHRVQVLRYSDGSHVRTIGSQGSGNGQFDSPYDVLIDG
jgi:DNA-binding beta-propeller fold protein YncE